MLTFRDLQLEVLRWIDEGEDTDTTLTNVKAAINRSHRKLLSSRTWPFMKWPTEVSFTTEPGQRVYALKNGVNKVLTLWDVQLSQPFPLVSRREWETMGIDRVGQQAVPAGALYGDVWPVSAQPADEVLTLTSSTDGDAGRGATFQGINTDGDLTTESVVLLDVGATSAVTTTTLWSHLFSVTKTGAWAGSLSLSGVTAGTILTLTASEYGKQYPTLEFIETPSGEREYLWTAQRTPTTLVNDHDIPDTPYPYSEFHIYDALLDMTTYNTELGAKEQRLWSERLKSAWDGLVGAVDEGIAGSHPRFVRNMNPRLLSRIHATRA